MNRANAARCLLPDPAGRAEPRGAVPARPAERGCCRCPARAEPACSAACRHMALGRGAPGGRQQPRSLLRRGAEQPRAGGLEISG